MPKYKPTLEDEKLEIGSKKENAANKKKWMKRIWLTLSYIYQMNHNKIIIVTQIMPKA